MMGEEEKEVSIPYHLTASAGDSGFKDIYTVPAFKRLRVRKVTIAFPSGTYGELDVALFYGVMKVFPENGYLTGDNMSFKKEVDLTWYSGENVRLYYNNRNTTEARECYVNLEGVIL